MSPAEEWTKAQQDSNAKRFKEIVEIFESAGLKDEVIELINIERNPCAAYSARIKHK